MTKDDISCSNRASLKNIKQASGLFVSNVCSNPFDFLKLLMDDIFLEYTFKFTNAKAEYVFLEKGSKKRARISNWRELIVEKLNIFLARLLRTVRLNMINDYWKTRWLFAIPSLKITSEISSTSNNFLLFIFLRKSSCSCRQTRPTFQN